jgi:hypothetical protein
MVVVEPEGQALGLVSEWGLVGVEWAVVGRSTTKSNPRYKQTQS